MWYQSKEQPDHFITEVVDKNLQDDVTLGLLGLGIVDPDDGKIYHGIRLIPNKDPLFIPDLQYTDEDIQENWEVLRDKNLEAQLQQIIDNFTNDSEIRDLLHQAAKAMSSGIHRL